MNIRLSLAALLVVLCGYAQHARAACSNPTGTAGSILYNSDSNLLQYCNDTSWVALGNGNAWNDIDGGDTQSCGIRGGAAYCWGTNIVGELGNDNLGTNSATPVTVGTAATGTLFNDWVKISASTDYNCGLRSGGTMWCWGVDTNGKLGNGATSGNYAYPIQVGTVGTSTVFSDWVYIAAGNTTACGIRSTGEAYCWGSGANGRIGNNAATTQSTPVKVGTAGTSTAFTDWTSISHKDQTGCGTRANGTAWCWGTGSNGQLGNGASSNSNFPVQVGTGGSGTDFTDWIKTSNGIDFSCGLRGNGTIWCWGNATVGELGNGVTTTSSNVPVQVGTGGTSTLFTDWTDLMSGNAFSCGVRSNGTAWCWGQGSNGRLGYNSTTTSNVPVQVGTAGTGTAFTDWVSVGLGTQTACAMRSNNTGWCWGKGTEGQVGNGLSSAANIVPKQPYMTCTAPTGTAGQMIYNTDYHMLQWCDGTQWNAVSQSYAGAGGGGCSTPTGTEGQLMYNTPNNALQYCDGTNWVGIGMSEAGNAPGTVEPDGTVYAGISPDTGTAMYVTPADAPTTYAWGSSGTLRGITSNTTGKANTTALAAFGAAAHPAAYYCDNLVANGHSDWYLPARDELLVVRANYVAIGGFDDVSVTNNWTSTENNSTLAIRVRWSDGNSSAVAKTAGRYVRCARTD